MSRRLVISVLVLGYSLMASVMIFSTCDDGEPQDYSVHGGDDDISDRFADDDHVEQARFVVSGSVNLDPTSDLVAIQLAPIVDSDGKVYERLSPDRFQVFEDGEFRPFSVQYSETKGWTYNNFKVVYDHTDSMKDEQDNSVYSLQPFLHFQVCDVKQYMNVQLAYFMDRASEAQVFTKQWWQPDLWWDLTNQIYNDTFSLGNNKAENPLNTIMALWNDASAWDSGYQRTFLLITDAPMHQPGDADSYEHDNTGYSLQTVCNTLQDAGLPAKGTVHVVSPQTSPSSPDGAYTTYWDNRSHSWDWDTIAGHANPKDLATCTGGTWYDIRTGDFYSGKSASESDTDLLLPKNMTIVFKSSDIKTPHNLKIRVRLENHQSGDLEFEDVTYPELHYQKSQPDCFPHSCQEIKTTGSSSGDGVYYVDPDGQGGVEPFQVYCDMTTLGGGWTLTMLSNANPPYAPTPTWVQATTQVTIRGTPFDLDNSDMVVGVSFWPTFGSGMMEEAGSSSTSIVQRMTWTYSTAVFNEANKYKLTLTYPWTRVGIFPAGTWTSHNGYKLSTWDQDNDVRNTPVPPATPVPGYNYSCSTIYGNTAWWYSNCYNGNIWGGGKPTPATPTPPATPNMGYEKDKGYWYASGGWNLSYNYEAIWVGPSFTTPTPIPNPCTTAPAGYTSCKAIKTLNPTAVDGRYCVDPDGAGTAYAAIQVWCDMTFEGGGWTLVMMKNASVQGSVWEYGNYPTGAVTYNNNTVVGDKPITLTGSNTWVGVKYWNSFGTTLRAEVGNSPTNILHRAKYTSFSLLHNPTPTPSPTPYTPPPTPTPPVVSPPYSWYRLQLAGEVIQIGSGSPGLYTTHNNQNFSAYNDEHDGSATGSCGSSYTYAPWFYAACWSGNFWGGGGGIYVHEDRPYWTGSSTSPTYNWGAIWLK